MKKKDLFLIGILLVVGIIGFFAFKGIQRFASSSEQILKFPWMEKYYGEYSLKDKQEIKIGDTNICQIQEDGTVSMTKQIS